MDQLTTEQVNALARPFLSIRERVLDFYRDPAHETAYQAWYLREYGHPAPDRINEKGGNQDAASNKKAG